MKKIWNAVYQTVGGRYAGGRFRGISALICAFIAAVLVIIVGTIGPWESVQYIPAALLAGGYAGMAGYFGAIFYQMFRR